MIKALRITLTGNIVYQNVEIYNYDSGMSLGDPLGASEWY